MHCLEIIKLQFGKKKTPYIALYFAVFLNNWYWCLVMSKKCVVALHFFWISITASKICFSRIVINCAKILRY